MQAHSYRQPLSSFLSLEIIVIILSCATAASAAISLIGSATNTVQLGTSLSVSQPTDNIGDVLIAHVTHSGCCSVTTTSPSGWTIISEENNSGGISELLEYKVVTASEPSNYTWSFSSAVNVAAGIVDYSGVTPTWPIDAYSAATGNGATMTAPSIVTTAATDELLARFAGLGNNDWTVPTGMSQIWDLDSGPTSTDANAWLADEALSGSGATGSVSTPQFVSGSWDGGLAALYPAPAPTITGTTYYVDSANGNDSNTGTSASAAWQHISKVESFITSPGLNPGDGVLFKGGDTWDEKFDVSGVTGSATSPIVFSSYGSGRPVIDGQGSRNYCIDAINTTAKYLTFNNFECEHAKQYGVTFQTSGGTMPGITVQNFYIHDTGPGCASKNGACVGTDDGNYRNQLDFEDFSQGSDGVHLINNTVKWCGGHNCLQVHYDTGAVQVIGNVVGPGGVHGFIDVKGVGSNSTPALIYRNIVDAGFNEGLTPNGVRPAYYTENTLDAGSSVTYQENIAYDVGVCYQFCPGGCTSGSCGLTGKYYNNTCFAADKATNGEAFQATTGCDGTAYSTSVDVRNNIFDGGGAATIDIGTGFASLTEDYNDIGGLQGNMGYSVNGSSTLAPHDLNAVDPKYIDHPNQETDGNFRIDGINSTLIDAGLSGLTTGNSDIGAY